MRKSDENVNYGGETYIRQHWNPHGVAWTPAQGVAARKLQQAPQDALHLEEQNFDVKKRKSGELDKRWIAAWHIGGGAQALFKCGRLRILPSLKKGRRDFVGPLWLDRAKVFDQILHASIISRLFIDDSLRRSPLSKYKKPCGAYHTLSQSTSTFSQSA